MDILLLTAPWDGRGVPPDQASRKEVPPLGLVAVAAALESKGHHASVLDAWQRGMTPTQAAEGVIETGASVVGVGGTTRQAPVMVEVARLIREGATNPPLLVAGGPHATVRPRSLLEGGFDAVVVGEGEGPMLELAAAMDSGGSLGGPSCLTPDREDRPVPAVTEPDRIPVPAWHLLDSRLYDQVAPVMSARGCPRRCYFCAVGGRRAKVRERPLADLASEINCLKALFHADLVEFLDDTLLSFPRRVDGLADLAAGRGLPWSGQGTVGDVLRLAPRLSVLVEKGLHGVFLGVESGSDAVLRHLGKNVRREDVRRAVDLLFSAGVKDVVLSFILGHPWETERSLDETVELVLEMAAQGARIQVSHLIPYPGTRVGDHPESLGVRLLEAGWEMYDGTQPLVVVPGVSADRVHERYLELLDRLTAGLMPGKVERHD